MAPMVTCKAPGHAPLPCAQAIAREKAGIMKAGRPVFASPQPEDAMEALRVSPGPYVVVAPLSLSDGCWLQAADG